MREHDLSPQRERSEEAKRRKELARGRGGLSYLEFLLPARSARYILLALVAAAFFLYLILQL